MAGNAGTADGAAGAPATDSDQALAPSAINNVLKGSGCGKGLPADQPTTVPGTPKGYLQYHVMQTGATLAANDPTRALDRTFWVRVPANYDPNRAYRVVYLGQGCGGFAMANTQTYPLFKESAGGTEQAIYVAIDRPMNGPNMDCYDGRAGLGSGEWEAFQLFHTVVDGNYCVDNNRVFIATYGDAGESLSNMWGCYFADNPQPPRKFAPNYHIRGLASVAGNEPEVQPTCGGPVAALWIHDTTDTSSPFSGGIIGLDRVLKTNGCLGDHSDSPSVAWAPMPDVCQRFTSCPRDYPVVFCTTQGEGHSWQDARAIAGFSAFFDRLELPGAASP